MIVNQDLEHLRLLSIFHYVVGGICILVGFFPIIHEVIGIMMLTGQMGGQDDEMKIIGLFFVVIASVMMLFYWTLGVLQLVAAGYLKQHHGHYTFCMVAAAASCVFMPIGTILGVFTIVTLSRPSVKALFAGEIPLPAAMPIFEPPPPPRQDDRAGEQVIR